MCVYVACIQNHYIAQDLISTTKSRLLREYANHSYAVADPKPTSLEYTSNTHAHAHAHISRNKYRSNTH